MKEKKKKRKEKEKKKKNRKAEIEGKEPSTQIRKCILQFKIPNSIYTLK
jgi:hypothetical protein